MLGAVTAALFRAGLQIYIQSEDKWSFLALLISDEVCRLIQGWGGEEWFHLYSWCKVKRRWCFSLHIWITNIFYNFVRTSQFPILVWESPIGFSWGGMKVVPWEFRGFPHFENQHIKVFTGWGRKWDFIFFWVFPTGNSPPVNERVPFITCGDLGSKKVVNISALAHNINFGILSRPRVLIDIHLQDWF